MKLIRLKINTKFRSLQKGFELHFRPSVLDSDAFNDLSNFHPFCFAGLNGSGKSNVLEALANIFYHMECCALKFQPENFKKHFSSEKSTPEAFELEYFIIPNKSESIIENTIKIRITKEADKMPKMKMLAFPFNDLEENWKNIEIEPTIKGESAVSKGFLPEFVIAYSSGENETLSIPFIKTKLLQFDEYTDALEKNDRYENPESGLLYMDYELSQAVLLANLLFQEKEVLTPLREQLGIK